MPGLPSDGIVLASADGAQRTGLQDNVRRTLQRTTEPGYNKAHMSPKCDSFNLALQCVIDKMKYGLVNT